MDSEKIIIILVVAVLAVVLVGLLTVPKTSYTGADPERCISFNGMDFEIPFGYVKINTKTVENERGINNGNTYIYNQETYLNYKGDEITIKVADYDDFDVDTDNIEKICEGADKKTMKGYPGYLKNNDNNTQFTFAFNNKAVTITAPNEDYIFQVLVVEDA